MNWTQNKGEFMNLSLYEAFSSVKKIPTKKNTDMYINNIFSSKPRKLPSYPNTMFSKPKEKIFPTTLKQFRWSPKKNLKS